MRPVTPFMAIRTVLRVTSFPSYAISAPSRPTGEQNSKRFLSREKLASAGPIGQDHAGEEMFDPPDGWTWRPWARSDVPARDSRA
ncbi:hypothetical protein GCM10023335_08310 [Streptomyces siamensis]|uniref:Secreted protein n=1 Tax=Streptomyces siamensis TaxID=1274986 RepID=A0ABP9IGK5_9ACTN